MRITVNDESVQVATEVKRVCNTLDFECSYEYVRAEKKCIIHIDCEPEHEDLVWQIVNRISSLKE